MTARNKKIRNLLSISVLSAAVACTSFSGIPVLQNFTQVEAQAAEDSSESDDAEDETVTAEKADGTISDYTISALLSDERKEVLLAALSLEGQICYTWGGKATTTGWNSVWDSGTGLDCSGFVQWAYWTGIGVKSGLGSTLQISYSYKKIKESELQPGDLGLLFKGGSGYEAANGKIYSTESEALAVNRKVAAKSVRRQLNGKEKITEKAVKKAKKAQKAYKTASAKAGGSERRQAKKLEQKAEEARSEAKELIAQAEEYESQAEQYYSTVTAQSLTVLSLTAFAAVTDDDEDTGADSDTADTDAADSADAGTDSSADTGTDTTDDTAADSSTTSDDPDSATDSTGSSSDSSAGSSSSSASAKGDALTAEAAKLRAQAASLKAKAAAWEEKADDLRKTAKKKRAAASVRLSKLKKKASIAKSEAISAVADSYEISLEVNHVGIYLGTDDDGNMLWIHCNSTKDTVSIDSVSYFTYFVRVIDSSDEHYTTVDEGDISLEDARKRSKGIRKIEKAIAAHKLFKFIIAHFDEETSLTALAEEQAALNVYADEKNV